MRFGLRAMCLMALGGLSGIVSVHTTVHAQNRIMGQVQFVDASREAKTSGVWVDGQYVGYLGELKGSNRLRLLPGDHDISIRQAGYSEFTQKVVIEPRSVAFVHVNMSKDARFVYPDPKTSSEVRLDVVPTRAAVFVDDAYVGTVDQF